MRHATLEMSTREVTDSDAIAVKRAAKGMRLVADPRRAPPGECCLGFTCDRLLYSVQTILACAQ